MSRYVGQDGDWGWLIVCHYPSCDSDIYIATNNSILIMGFNLENCEGLQLKPINSDKNIVAEDYT